MEEKKIVYDVILSIWNLAKEFDFKNLSDNEWQSFIEKANEQRNRFKQNGENIDLLFRDMYRALENYYERKKNV